jgi:hypothetical protein
MSVIATRSRSSGCARPYRIRTMPVWVDGETVKGYKVEQFGDAFARVVGVRRLERLGANPPLKTSLTPLTRLTRTPPRGRSPPHTRRTLTGAAGRLRYQGREAMRRLRSVLPRPLLGDDAFPNMIDVAFHHGRTLFHHRQPPRQPLA